MKFLKNLFAVYYVGVSIILILSSIILGPVLLYVSVSFVTDSQIRLFGIIGGAILVILSIALIFIYVPTLWKYGKRALKGKEKDMGEFIIKFFISYGFYVVLFFAFTLIINKGISTVKFFSLIRQFVIFFIIFPLIHSMFNLRALK